MSTERPPNTTQLDAVASMLHRRAEREAAESMTLALALREAIRIAEQLRSLVAERDSEIERLRRELSRAPDAAAEE